MILPIVMLIGWGVTAIAVVVLIFGNCDSKVAKQFVVFILIVGGLSLAVTKLHMHKVSNARMLDYKYNTISLR
jgi:hypothetical protein